jgi:hypothetical protein
MWSLLGEEGRESLRLQSPPTHTTATSSQTPTNTIETSDFTLLNAFLAEQGLPLKANQIEP